MEFVMPRLWFINTIKDMSPCLLRLLALLPGSTGPITPVQQKLERFLRQLSEEFSRGVVVTRRLNSGHFAGIINDARDTERAMQSDGAAHASAEAVANIAHCMASTMEYWLGDTRNRGEQGYLASATFSEAISSVILAVQLAAQENTTNASPDLKLDPLEEAQRAELDARVAIGAILLEAVMGGS